MRRKEQRGGGSNEEKGATRREEQRGGRNDEEKGALSIQLLMKKGKKLKIKDEN